MNDKTQQTFFPKPSNIISNPANTFGLIPLIYQLIITSILTQIDIILFANLPQQFFNTFANSYVQILPIKVPNKMLSLIIVAQFIKT